MEARRAEGAALSSYWALIVGAAEQRPEAIVASDDRGRSLTRVGLVAEAESVAAALHAGGLGPGDMVSWQLPTTLEALVVLAAAARLGVVQNPVIPILRHREVDFIAGQVRPQLLVVPTSWRGVDHRAMARTITSAHGGDVLELDLSDLDRDEALRLPHGDPTELPPPPAGDGEVRWIYYSSGTTAEPKGVRHSDATIIASANGLLAGIGFTAGDVYPIAWPLAHIGGASMLTASLVGGVQLVLFDSFDPATTAQRMATHRPTLVGTALPFFRALLDAQRRRGSEPLFPELRAGAFGGAPVPAEIHDEMRAVFGIALVGAWGLTEFPNATSAAPTDPAEVCLHTVGRAAPGVEVRVVATAADGTETVCSTDAEGELRLRGPQCFLGYLDPALDAAAFDEDGWFRTGDLGRIDAAGNVRITGRSKEVIIRNAENISVGEIEELLFRVAAVADGAIIGLPDAAHRRAGVRSGQPPPGGLAGARRSGRGLPQRAARPLQVARATRGGRGDPTELDGQGAQARVARPARPLSASR